jgi:hypothetical protein
MTRFLRSRRSALALALVVAAVATAAGARRLRASDHQDTPEVELAQRMDINDVYAFPAATAGNVALVMTTASPITPAASATTFFDPNLLYQIKVDTNTTPDGVEDLVFQVTFTGNDANQQVKVVGPVKPATTGTMNTLVASGPTVTGTINTALASGGMQVFAGLRADPFFIDLTQFFNILNDRRPSTGPLSVSTTPQAAWRPACNGSNAGSCAVNFLNGINTLAIVIELPLAQIKTSGKFGVWGTISR